MNYTDPEIMLAELEAQRDAVFEELEWLRARNGFTPTGTVDIDLEDRITIAESKWLGLVVACMAWTGTPPSVPGFLN